MTAAQLEAHLKSLGDPEKAAFHQRFFRTGPGEYGEGDVFLGIEVPELRRLSREHRAIPVGEAKKLLRSKYHEARLLALFMLVLRYEKGDEETRDNIYRFYLRSAKHVNNWDLVDLSAPRIVGAHLLNRPRKPVHDLARSRDLWRKRIAMLATYAFIKEDDFDDALRVAETLVRDEHDLIHKAVGWMLREIGKRDRGVEEAFLAKHYKTMPRTMLRYAIEKFPERTRKRYLRGEV